MIVLGRIPYTQFFVMADHSLNLDFLVLEVVSFELIIKSTLFDVIFTMEIAMGLLFISSVYTFNLFFFILSYCDD